MIKLKNVYKSFRKNIVFQDVSFEIPPGKKIYLTGENGSGKSILLKLILGYSRPDHGLIEADGYIIGKDTEFLKDAGASINNPEFNPHISGLESLAELASIRRIADKQSILKYAQQLHFEEDIYKNYRQYSAGMKQKLRFIQAIMDQPKYLLLDEIFDSLDQESKAAVQMILNEYISDPDRYLIFTSHEIPAEGFADLTLRIKNNKIEAAD